MRHIYTAPGVKLPRAPRRPSCALLTTFYIVAVLAVCVGLALRVIG